MPSMCRDCFEMFGEGRRCPSCRSPRVASHPELFSLHVAHMDCDAFYASVEKRDNPELRDKPVIIGGRERGVVSTACYIARIKGVRSAMPMFQALKLCPDAVVVRPRMEAYAETSRAVRAMMSELTPLVEPLSLDEAFMDLSGTEKLHGYPPSVMLAKLVRRMKAELGVTGSIGLSHNKFLAKVASDLDKPRGYSIIGKRETSEFLRAKPVRLIWGIGPSTQSSLERVGIRTFDDLLRWEMDELQRRFGKMGLRLWHLARGRDARGVSTKVETKGISNETTFSTDTADIDILEGHIWRLSERVSDRAKAMEKAGRIVTLKLKTSDHRIVTRRTSLHQPTQLADTIYRTARALFEKVEVRQAYRLIGVGINGLVTYERSIDSGDLLDPDAGRRELAERATDQIRAKFGEGAIVRGRALR